MIENNFESLESVFNHIRENFEPTGEGLTREERDRQREIRQRIAQHPTETSMISSELGDWFQEKIDVLEGKLGPRFFEISPTGDRLEIIAHCRNTIVDRLQRLLADSNFNYDNLLEPTQEGVEARKRFCEKISTKIARKSGDEKERYIEAFELIIALQALSPGDPVYGTYANPFFPDLSLPWVRDSSIKWLTYIYLATQFFEREDITLQIDTTGSDQDLKDNIFQFFVRMVSDIIRGHNEDHWPHDRFHPKNAPSCVPGAEGRLILGSSWYKDLALLNTPEPIFNDPGGNLEAAMITKMLSKLTVDSSRQLLNVLNEVMDGFAEYPFRDFFNFTEEEKDQLINSMVSELIAQWSLDLSDEDKVRAMATYRESVAGLLRTQMNELLENKFNTQYLAGPDSKFYFNVSTFDRFRESALKRLFDSESAAEIFIEFYDMPGIMALCFKEYGAHQTVCTLYELKNSPAMNRVNYLQLLTDLVVVMQNDVNTLIEDRHLIKEILLVDPNDKGKGRLVAMRNQLLSLPWDQLRKILNVALGPSWTTILVEGSILSENSLLDSLLDQTLKVKNYTDFEKITQCFANERSFTVKQYVQFKFNGIRINIDEEPYVSDLNAPAETLAASFIAQANQAIQKTLLEEFGAKRVYLLNHLSKIDYHAGRIAEFLGNLTPEQVKELLDMEELGRYPGLLEKIISRLPTSCGHATPDGYLTDVNLSEAKQIEILNYLITSEIGGGSLAYINYLSEQATSERVKEKANECWNQLCEQATDSRNLLTCKAFLKLGEEAPTKACLGDLYAQYTNSEDEEAKKDLKEEIKGWLALMMDEAVPSNWAFIQEIYNQAYAAEDWALCRLFLPIFNRDPGYYNLLPGVTPLLTLSEKKGLCANILSNLVCGEEDKPLLIAILNKAPGVNGTFLDSSRVDNDIKLKALSHLVVHFQGFDKAVNPACEELFEFAKKELEKIVEPLLDNLLSQEVTTSKQLAISEVTGDFIKELGNYFAQMPEDPEEAFAAYQKIIETTRQAVEEKLNASFDLTSFLLNALLVLLTGGLALIPILINKANHKPDFFSSDVTKTPKTRLDSTLNKLTTAGAANGFFASRRRGEDEDAGVGPDMDEEKKLTEHYTARISITV